MSKTKLKSEIEEKIMIAISDVPFPTLAIPRIMDILDQAILSDRKRLVERVEGLDKEEHLWKTDGTEEWVVKYDDVINLLKP